MSTNCEQLKQIETKKARIAFVKNLLSSNEAWATRAVNLIYSYQTDKEQADQATEIDNGVGFTGVDGHILSSFAEQIKAFNDAKAKGTNRYPSALSVKQMALVYRKMPKYAGQIVNILEEKGFWA